MKGDAGDDGNSAADDGSSQTYISFDDALERIEASRLNPDNATGDDAAAGKADEGDDEDKTLEGSDENDDLLFEKDKDDDDKDDDDKDVENKDKDSDKDKKADPDATDAKDKTKAEDGEEKDEKDGKKAPREQAFTRFKEKAIRLDALEETYADIGGVAGFEDFADLIRSYKDPSKVDDFIGAINELTPTHASKIRDTIFYQALDLPENQVEVINDALLGLGAISSLKIPDAVLVKDHGELQKILAYIGVLLEDDRDDFFKEVDRTIKDVTFSAEAAKAAPGQTDAKAKESRESAGGESDIVQMVADYETYAGQVLDKRATPEFDRRGLLPQKSDSPELKAAKEELIETFRERARNLVGKTALGGEVSIDINALKGAGDKPPARIKNLMGRYETAINATVRSLLNRIAPAMRGGRAPVPADKDEKDTTGSDDIITNKADKGASLDSDDKSKIDWSKEKDPFDTRLRQIGRSS